VAWASDLGPWVVLEAGGMDADREARGWIRGAVFERRKMLAVSTSWRSEISDDGLEVIQAILDLGVGGVELEYRITPSMVKEILPLLKKERISVTSLHNFFPLPDGLPKEKAGGDVFSLSAPDGEERALAVKYTLRTMEWAEELGARAVVLHLGKIPMDDPMQKLKKLYDQKKIQTEEGRIFIEAQRKVRARNSLKHLDAALRSLEKLALEADRRRISLGLENRFNLQDFPDLDEFKKIFKEFSGGPVGYWHDLGHATVQQNLGLADSKEFLENFSELLVGVHLHGCRGYDDHYAPGSGGEDYSLLQNFLRPDTLLVVETHHRASREEMLQGLEFLRGRRIS
jgi:sugar phosphate isomerase/epimerase